MDNKRKQALLRYKPTNGLQEIEFRYEYSLDLMLSPGCYTIEIDHTNSDMGLPLEFCGNKHYVVGTLIVTDSGTYGPLQSNRVTGQVLALTSCKQKETNVYSRTRVDDKWSNWRSLAVTGMFDDISSTDELVATVAGLVDESIRAKQVAENVKRTAVDISSLSCTAGNVNVAITGSSMDREVVRSIEIPVATNDTAGVMSVEDKQRLKNVEDVYTELGYINISDGAFVASDKYKASSYILVDRKNGISIKNGNPSASCALVAFYDKNKKYISGVRNVADIYMKDDIPESAVYYRTSTTSNYNPIVNCNVAQIMDVVIEDNATLTSAVGIVKDLDKSVFPAYTVEFPNNGYMNNSGKITGADGFSRHSNKIRINGNMRGIYATCVMSSAAYSVMFFDKDGNVMSDICVVGTNKPVGHIKFTEEQLKADSFIVQYYANNDTNAAERSICYFTDFAEVPLMARMEYMHKSTYSGLPLNILIFGDSITDNAKITIVDDATTSYSNRDTTSYVDAYGNTITHAKWAKILEKYFRCADLRNYALSGASYKDAVRQSGNERQNLSYQVTLALNDAGNPNGVFPTVGEFVPDIVIFALGTNDGVANDTYDSAMAKTVYKADGVTIDYDATLAALDTSKFCEAVRKAFMRVRKQWPRALYFCVLPIQRVARDQQPANESLRQMAQRYSMIVVDGAAEMGIVRDFEVGSSFGTFLKDGLHPNKEGQQLFARLVVNAIKNNYIDMSLME